MKEIIMILVLPRAFAREKKLSKTKGFDGEKPVPVESYMPTPPWPAASHALPLSKPLLISLRVRMLAQSVQECPSIQ